MDPTLIKPGKLVRLRHRDWIVQPSAEPDLLRIKPLGGTEAEATAIYLPFGFANEQIEEVYFPRPGIDDLGDSQSALLLYDAIRLSFRDASGPFRSIARFNFTPRAYQMVPLIMALRQHDPVRLFIADDVGIGKTIESLMVAREMLDRGKINRFAVVCLPHLCDQWQREMEQKFGLEAVVIRSSTAASLDRKTPGDQSAFAYYPFQVISIDYVKSDKRIDAFVKDCPELVIVDEAHTCSASEGKSRHQRHQLLKRISQKADQHLILLSATPHSGKAHEFQSLLGLLQPEFGEIELGSHSTDKQRRALAKHYVQRRRKDIEKWDSKKRQEVTHFPERESIEVPYALTADYLELQFEVMKLARQIADHTGNNKREERINYWTALSLLRGVMSSPAAGITMLENRAQKRLSNEELEAVDLDNNPVIENDYGFEGDREPLLFTPEITPAGQPDFLHKLSPRLHNIREKGQDLKIVELVRLVKKWHKDGFNPIVFCRYIRTAEYVGEHLREALPAKVGVSVVTSSDTDEVRQEKVDALGESATRVLVATDCMSEGINLQQYFTAVIHYDLPWNPNRLEQREGRVDRFGQSADVVRSALLYGQENPMDGIVLKVLLRKAREIKKAIGVSVPFPENNQSIMEAVTQAVLVRSDAMHQPAQLSLFDELEVVDDSAERVGRAYREIENVEKATRSIFAQHAVRAQDIDQDIVEAIRLIGDMESVEQFTVAAVEHFGGGVKKIAPSRYLLTRTGLPSSVQHYFGEQVDMDISFESPTPEGYRYVARNHPLVDALSHTLINEAMERKGTYRVSRASVIRTRAVEVTTHVLLLRVRNVIESIATRNQLVAEELLLRGYTGVPGEETWLPEARCMELLRAEATAEVAPAERRDTLEDVHLDLEELKETLDQMGRQQAEKLIEAHDRFREAVKGRRFQVVEPILPMDIMGIYVFIPDRT